MSCYVNTATIGRRPHQGARAAHGAPPAVEDEDTYSLYYQGIRYERFLTSKTFLGYGDARRDRAELRRYGGSEYLGKERRRVGTSVGGVLGLSGHGVPGGARESITGAWMWSRDR